MTKQISKIPCIWFINTFPPVAPIYSTVFPLLQDKGYQPIALISQGAYRETIDNDSSDFWTNYSQLLWVPPFLRKNKRWCALFYYCIAPLKLLFSSASLHIFLTQPPLFFVCGAAIARVRNIPYIVHIMDNFPDVLVRLNFLNEQGIMYKILAKLAINSLHNAVTIIVIGRCMKDQLIAQGISADKITIIPNWVEDNIKPINRENNEFIKINKLENKFIVMYSGNMGLAHDLRTILKAAELLSDYPNIVFLFIGKGVRRNEVEQAINQGNSQIKLLDYQPQSMLPYSLASADLHFISLRAGFEGVMVPSKFYGALASGKPVIYEGNEQGEVARVIQEVGCGAVIKPGDVTTMVDKILYYYHNREAVIREGNQALSANHKNYQANQLAQGYIEAILPNIQQKFNL